MCIYLVVNQKVFHISVSPGVRVLDHQLTPAVFDLEAANTGQHGTTVRRSHITPSYHELIWSFVAGVKCLKHTLVKHHRGSLSTAHFQPAPNSCAQNSSPSLPDLIIL